VTYNIVSFPNVGHWGISEPIGFAVNDKATVNFKNIDVGSTVVLLSGSTLQVEEDGHLSVSWGQYGLLDLRGNLELILPAGPSGEYVIAEYRRRTGRFASAAGLPPDWRIEYGSGTDDAIRAVREPSSVALLAMGAFGLAAKTRRRRESKRFVLLSGNPSGAECVKSMWGSPCGQESPFSRLRP